MHQLFIRALKFFETEFFTDENLVALIVAAVSLLLLVAFQTAMHAGDSLSFAYDISIGQKMAHPHHLLFSPIVWLLYKAGSVFSSDFSALAAAKIHDIAWGTTGIVIAYFIGNKLFNNRFPALLLSLFILISLQFVIFSSSCEVYIPGMVCLMVVFYLCIPDSNRNTLTVDVPLVFFLSLAILYNQPSILIVPALLIYNFTNKAGWKKNKPIFIAGMVVLFIYIITFVLQENSVSPKKFIHFVFAYLVGGEKNWGAVSNISFNGFFTLLHSQLSVIVNIDSDTHQPLVFLFGCLLFISLGWHLRQHYKKADFYKERLLLVLWIIGYELFIFWWTPGYELLISMIFPVLLLFVWLIADCMKIILEKVKNQHLKFISITVLMLMCSAVLGKVWLKNYPVLKQYHEGPDPSKLEADWDWKNLEPNYQIIQGYGPQIGLLYYHHFTESIEVDRLLSCFYFNEPLPDYLKLKPGYGCIVPNWFLNPWYENNGTSGMKQPDEWMNYFSYLFDYRKSEGSDSVCMNQFSIILPEEKDQLVLIKISAEQNVYPSINSFMQKLDSTFIALKLDTEPTYSTILIKLTSPK